MSMLNKILGKKDDQKDNSPSKRSTSSGDAFSQGFLCPICFMSFENSDVLTHHFNNVHDNSFDNTSTNENSINNSKNSAGSTSMNPIVESILKKYGSNSLNNSATEAEETRSLISLTESNQRDSQLEKDLANYKEKLLTSEEIRNLLSSDLSQLTEANNQLNLTIRKLTKDKKFFEERYQSLLNEYDEIKPEHNRLSSENESIKINLKQIQEEYVKKSQLISELENEITLRPTLDDINLLKKELVQVQQLTDTILKEKENEQKLLIREKNEISLKLEKKIEELNSINDKVEQINELEELRKRCAIQEERISTLEKNEVENQQNAKILNETIEKQKNHLDETNNRNNELKKDLESKNAQITNYLIEIKDLNHHNNQLKENISELESKKIELLGQIHSNSINEEKKDSNEANNQMMYLIKEKENIDNELKKVRSSNQTLNEEKVEWLKEKNEFLIRGQSLEKQIDELNQKIKNLENENSIIFNEKQDALSKINYLEETIRSSTELTETIKTEIDLLKKELVVSNEKADKSNDKIQQVQSEKLNLEEKLKALENDLNERRSAHDSDKKNYLESVNSFEQNINDLNKEKEFLTSELGKFINLLEEQKKLSEMSLNEHSTNAKHLETKISQLESKAEELANEKDKEKRFHEELSKEFSKLKFTHDEISASKSELETRYSNAENEIKRQDLANKEVKKELEESISKNLELNDQLIILKSQLSDISSKNEELEKKIEKLNNDIDEVKMEKDDCERMRQDAVKKHDTQLKALNQNLAGLRNELKLQNEKLAQADLIINTVKGDNLELEAKLSNCNDEINQLLERCLFAEKQHEVLKSQNIELKRKLEDTQAGLQELGREHQMLQVQINKKSNYKWVDDGEVSECTHCKKLFSVTIRKHHCRNCGQVFCYECSDHTATVSSSKKPQRVCKACFIELTN